MKNGTVVTRNGNFFLVKKSKTNHYYTALLLGNARVTAWHRTTLKHIQENFKIVENYDGNKERFEGLKDL